LALTRGIASQTPSTSGPLISKRVAEAQPHFLGNSQKAVRIWQHVLNEAAQKRRLILGWLEKTAFVEYNKPAGLFQVYFSADDKSAFEGVSAPRTHQFIQGLVNEIEPNAKIEWHYIPL
jgi:hypothetical protein